MLMIIGSYRQCFARQQWSGAGQTCFILDLNKNVSTVSPPSVTLDFELRCEIFYHVKKVSLNFIFMKLRMSVKICQKLCCILLCVRNQFFFSFFYRDILLGENNYLYTSFGFEHAICFKEWNLINGGSVSVSQSKASYVSAHPFCVSASTIRRTRPEQQMIQMEKHMEQTRIHPAA